jgi:hypothetical protein
MRRSRIALTTLAMAVAAATGIAAPAFANFTDQNPDCSQSDGVGDTQLGHGAFFTGGIDLKATFTGAGATNGDNDENGGCKHMQGANPIYLFGQAAINIRLPKKINGHSYKRPTAKDISRSVSATFSADSRVTTGGESNTSENGSISVSKKLVTGKAGISHGSRYTYKVVGGTKTLKVPASAATCNKPTSAGADWLMGCKITLPYDTWTYRQPVGRRAGGFLNLNVRFGMSVKYAGMTFRAPMAFPLKANS